MPLPSPIWRLPRRAFAALLAVCLLPLPALADEETAAMLLTFDAPAILGQGMAEAVEPADPEQDRFNRWVLENAYDEAEVARRLGEAIGPAISAEDRASYRAFVERGGAEFTAALRQAPGTTIRDRAAGMPRRLRRAFAAYDETGATARLFDAIDSPAATAAFMAYIAETYCRASRDLAPDLWGHLEDESCAAADMFSGRQAAPGPEMTAGASPEAVAVLRLFNVPWVFRETVARGMGTSDDPAEAAMLRALIDYLDEDEVLAIIGAELDRRVSASDVARVAAFAGTDNGRILAAAMHGKMPEDMDRAAASLPAATQREIDAFLADGSLERIATAMNDPVFEQLGMRYGQLLFCRAAPDHLPDMVPALIAGGVCRPETMGAPATGGTLKRGRDAKAVGK